MASLNRILKHRRNIGLVIGVALGLLLVAFLVYPKRNALVAKGPMNAGHEALGCEQCHTPVKATPAQQVSANIYYWLGLRRKTIGFGSKPVDTDDCIDCHERPNDRHPVSRFLEPRFADARKHIKAYDCIACHAEHQGKRVTLPTLGYCMHCHQDTELSDDPILPTHAAIIRGNSWNSCLQCHDFHGNHMRDTPTRIQDAVSESELWRYFHGGASPYSAEKFVYPSDTRAGE